MLSIPLRISPLLTGPTQRRLRRFSDKSKTFWTAGTFVRVLALVPFLFFWFLRKMALGACVLIVEPLITSPFDIAILFLGWMTCLTNSVVLLFSQKLTWVVATTRFVWL